MREMRLADSARWAILTEDDVPEPNPGLAEVLIRVGAVPGDEFCGVTTGVGRNVSSFEIGEEVYGMNDWFSEGATAEYCIATAAFVAPKPARNVDFVAGLGAEEVIDFQRTLFEDVSGQVDVVFDTAGGETLERSWSGLKPGGRMVTIASTPGKISN